MLSLFPQISLRYQLVYFGSRSMVCDPTLGPSGTTQPLFRRGTDRDRFETGLLWLYRDVEQLLVARGLTFEPDEELLHNIGKLYQCEACAKLAL